MSTRMATRTALSRRMFLRQGAALTAGLTISLAPRARAAASRARVVVIGGGYGGATAAKYLRLWSDGAVEVTLVESAPAFVSCPLSNLVLGGSKSIDDIT